MLEIKLKQKLNTCLQDLHINSNRSLQIDQHQDWKLVGAWEKGKRTYLSFIRSMDTCDFQDYPITVCHNILSIQSLTNSNIFVVTITY